MKLEEDPFLGVGSSGPMRAEIGVDDMSSLLRRRFTRHGLHLERQVLQPRFQLRLHLYPQSLLSPCAQQDKINSLLVLLFLLFLVFYYSGVSDPTLLSTALGVQNLDTGKQGRLAAELVLPLRLCLCESVIGFRPMCGNVDATDVLMDPAQSLIFMDGPNEAPHCRIYGLDWNDLQCPTCFKCLGKLLICSIYHSFCLSTRCVLCSDSFFVSPPSSNFTVILLLICQESSEISGSGSDGANFGNL